MSVRVAVGGPIVQNFNTNKKQLQSSSNKQTHQFQNGSRYVA